MSRFKIPAILIAYQIILWAPTNWSMGPVLEEWDFLGVFAADSKLYWFALPSERFGSLLRTRPLLASPFSLASALDSDSSIGFNIVLLSLICLRSFSLYSILRTLNPTQPLLIWTIIATSYPADTQLYTFRSLPNTHALAFASIALALEYTKQARAVARACMGVVSAIIGIAAVLTYTPSIAVICMGLIILLTKYYVEGNQKAPRIPIISMASIFVIVSVWLSFSRFFYVGSSYEETASYVANPLVALRNLLEISIPRVLLGGWIDAAIIVINKTSFSFKIALLVSGYFILSYLKKSSLNPSLIGYRWSDTLPTRLVFLLACVIMITGLLPFAILQSHVVTTQRTYLAASLGATLATAAGVELLRVGLIKRLIVTCLLLLAVTQSLYQYRHYTAISAAQAAMLSKISAFVTKSVDVLQINDYTGYSGSTWSLGPGLKWAIFYLTGRDINSIRYCYPELGIAGTYEQLSYGRLEDCYTPVDGGDDGRQIQVVCFDWPDLVSTAVPTRCGSQSSSGEAESRSRRQSWITEVAYGKSNWSDGLFRDDDVRVGRTGYSAGNLWGLERPPLSPGFRGIEWPYITVSGLPVPFMRQTAHWTQSRRSFVSIGRLQGRQSYVFEFIVKVESQPDITRSYVFKLLEEPLKCSYDVMGKVSCLWTGAESDVLGELYLEGPVPSTYGLGIMISEIKVIPLTKLVSEGI